MQPHGWWVYDMMLPCYQGAHRTLALFTGLLGVPLVVVGVPLSIFLLLYKNAYHL